jgi:hypothetical protein
MAEYTPLDSALRDFVRHRLGLQGYTALVVRPTAGAPGFLDVRYAQTDISEGLPTSVQVEPGLAVPTSAGAPVLVRYNPLRGTYTVMAHNASTLKAAAINPIIVNPIDSGNTLQWVNTLDIVALLSTPTSPASDEVVVFSWHYLLHGAALYFPGGVTGDTDAGHDSIASLIPGSGLWRVAGIFLRPDGTLNCVGSSTYPSGTIPDNIPDAIYQETVDAAEPGAIPIAWWLLQNGQTTIDSRPVRDGRQWIAAAEDIGGLPTIPSVIKRPTLVPEDRQAVWFGGMAFDGGVLQVDGTVYIR